MCELLRRNSQPAVAPRRLYPQLQPGRYAKARWEGVLQGHLSPIAGVGYDDIRLDEFLDRLRGGGVTEVILATSPTVEGDATAIEIGRLIAELAAGGGIGQPPSVTRIALGLPVGSDLDYADGLTLARALRGRTPLL